MLEQGLIMEKGTKFRILYLYQYLIRNSDCEHPISTMELIRILKEDYGIDVNRNTIGKDLEIMNKSGLHIEVIHSTQNKYYFDGQTFDIAELKILIDAISSSKFITERKSEELIGKLLTLTNRHGANQLRRHLHVSGRVKSDNEKGYYIVDAINEAIDLNRKISFTYSEYDQFKNKIERHNGEEYILSPYSMLWDGDYYYVIGFAEKREKIQTFRLDRISRPPKVLDEIRTVPPDDFDIASYSKAVFSMYDAERTQSVTLKCKNYIMNALIDNFGIDVDTKPIDDCWFEANVSVYPSPTFYRWIFGWNGDIQILYPSGIKAEFIGMLQKQLEY